MSKMLDEIRKAIDASGKTRYRIWQETGLTQAHLSKVMSGERGLSLDAMETLAECLGLEIMIRPKRRRKGG